MPRSTMLKMNSFGQSCLSIMWRRLFLWSLKTRSHPSTKHPKTGSPFCSFILVKGSWFSVMCKSRSFEEGKFLLHSVHVFVWLDIQCDSYCFQVLNVWGSSEHSGGKLHVIDVSTFDLCLGMLFVWLASSDTSWTAWTGCSGSWTFTCLLFSAAVSSSGSLCRFSGIGGVHERRFPTFPALRGHKRMGVLEQEASEKKKSCSSLRNRAAAIFQLCATRTRLSYRWKAPQQDSLAAKNDTGPETRTRRTAYPVAGLEAGENGAAARREEPVRHQQRVRAGPAGPGVWPAQRLPCRD